MRAHYSWRLWRGKTLDERLWPVTDRFTARYYTRDMLSDISGVFFDLMTVAIFGQDADAVPLPSRLRGIAPHFLPEAKQRERMTRRGAFPFVTATKPPGARTEFSLLPAPQAQVRA